MKTLATILTLGAAATLTLNDSGKYEDRWVRLGVDGQRCVFLKGIENMYLPVAHAEGKFVTRDRQMLDQLAADGQLVLRYRQGAFVSLHAESAEIAKATE